MTGVTSTQATVTKPQSDVQQFPGSAEKAQNSLVAMQEAAYDANEKLAQNAQQQEVKKSHATSSRDVYSFWGLSAEATSVLKQLDKKGIPQAQILETLSEGG